MIDLDRLLENSKPPAVSDASGTGVAARKLARETVGKAATLRRPFRWQWAVALGAAFVLGGTTTALASPALFGLAPWNAETAQEEFLSVDPDLVYEREFAAQGTSGGGSCVITLTARPDNLTAGADAIERLEEAKRFLRTFDLSTLDGDTENQWAQERARSTASGDHRPTRHASLLAAQIQSEFESAGYLGRGVSLELGYGCDGVAQ